MSLIIDTIYMNRLSPRLEGCKRKSEFLWIFRCPICGDSHSDKTKKRGYVYRKKNDLHFFCHNCGDGYFFNKFLKRADPPLYGEYLVDTFKDKGTYHEKKEPVSVPKSNISFPTRINLPKISELLENHFAKQFLIDRKIPKEWFPRLYFSSDFGSFVKEMVPDYETKSYNIINEFRIIIPIYDEQKNLVAFQGRALMKSKAKYITIKIDAESVKIFGMDTVDYSKRVYVAEGPFDSMFLQNSVATSDAAIYKVASLFPTATYISDNEPDNRDIKRVMRRIIDLSLELFIWPSMLKPFKDINEAIKAGYTSSQLMNIIDNNTFRGLNATLEMQNWEKGK